MKFSKIGEFRPQIIAVLVFSGVLFLSWWLTFSEDVNSTDLKNYAEISAIVGAGTYFVYRARAGFFLINVSLRVECVRTSRDKDTDHLICKIHLKKGERGTLEIHDAQLRIHTHDGDPRVLPIEELQRLSWMRGKLEASGRIAERVEVQWDRRSNEAPFYNMTPGEEAEFACYVFVPRSEVVLVQVIILGKRRLYPNVAQWRATCVSTPTPPVAEIS
jgi:hypothetical protein